MRSLSFPLLPKAMFAFLLLGWQGRLENSANMRSRRLQTPRRRGRGKTSSVWTHTHICLPSQERPWSPESRWWPWWVIAWHSGEGTGMWTYTGLTSFLATETSSRSETSLIMASYPYLGVDNFVTTRIVVRVKCAVTPWCVGGRVIAEGVRHRTCFNKSSLPLMFVNKLLLAHTHIHLRLSMAAYTLQWQSWIIAAETMWWAKPESLINCPFTEVRRPLSQTRQWPCGIQSSICVFLTLFFLLGFTQTPPLLNCLLFHFPVYSSFSILDNTIGFGFWSSWYILQHVNQYPTCSKCVTHHWVWCGTEQIASEEGDSSDSRERR